MFRLHKCNLFHPEGEICQQLHSCIVDSKREKIGKEINGTDFKDKNSSVIQQKMEKLEEILENLLLFIGGAGLVTTIKPFIQLPRHIRRLKERIRPFLEELKE